MPDSYSTPGRVLLLIGRLALGAVFLFAAYSKMPWKQPAVLFALTVDSYQLLGPKAVEFVAHTLPWFELVVGLLLLTGWQLRYVALAASALLGAFFGVMVRTYAKGLEINCGCFGPGERLGVKTLLRDGSLVALALAVTVGAFVSSRRRTQAIAPAPETQKAD